MATSRWMSRGLQILLIAVVLVYAADWITIRIRISHGTAFRTIEVHELLATALKGNKEEYDYNGDLPTTCSRSLFPQAGNPPCWWLERHTILWE